MKLDQDSTSVPLETPAATGSGAEKRQNSRQTRIPHPLVAYDIAASAASYVQSRAKDLLSIGSETQLEISDAVLHAKGKHQEEEEVGTPPQIHKSEMAACVAASTMTAVVAADEKQKQEAARDLQSLHSSPCEWFVCDDLSIYTRCFVIQVIIQVIQDYILTYWIGLNSRLEGEKKKNTLINYPGTILCY